MKPIIMSTEDVRGILDGRKTMARMAIKHQPDKSAIYMGISCGRARFETDTDMWNMMLPYNLGDVLWVRETWARLVKKEYLYQADDPDINVWKIRQKNGISTESDRWMSPVTMPREAARLFLRVKDVRVERVQDITEADSVKEGVYTDTPGYWDNGWSPSFNDPDSGGEPNYINGFKVEWDARNAKRGYGWYSNPYVWVIEFERTPSGAIGPKTDGTAPNGDKGAEQ